MPTFYHGTLRALEHHATVRISPKRADVTSHYVLENRGKRPVTERIEATRTGLRHLGVRSAKGAKAAPESAQQESFEPTTRRLRETFAGGERRIVDIDYACDVAPAKSGAFVFTPSLRIGDEALHQPLRNYAVTFELPETAKRVIYSSVPLKTRRTKRGLVCAYQAREVYPLPISIKWTDQDVDVTLVKKAKIGQLRGQRIVTVTLTLRNRGNAPVKGLLIEDSYTPEQAAALKDSKELKLRFSSTHEFQRLVYSTRLDLSRRGRKTLTYSFVPRGPVVSFGRAHAVSKGGVVAVSNDLSAFHFPPPFVPTTTAFAIPAGWSFDYLSDDHHLNEHGMWCDGENYNPATGRLTWSTGAVSADKNFDDDYRWSASHQVFRFTPGFAYHGSSGWLPKTGSVSTVPGSYSHAALKDFTSAIVLLRGWHFDFRSDDHHINRMTMRLSNIVFNKAQGTLTWNLTAEFADKNFDDDYRYRYFYTVLAFNGKYALRAYSGTDTGGTAADARTATMASLKGFKNGMVVPLGWTFDYKSDDHHINEHSFRIQNVVYSKSTGQFDWTAHLNYSDKNFDDDYTWRYDVALIATDEGECQAHNIGPLNDNGGYASHFNSVLLNDLFTPITWENEVLDGDETGVDCGGSSPAKDLKPVRSSVNPGSASDAGLFSLKPSESLNYVRTYAEYALVEYALGRGADPMTFYDVPEKPDRYVEAIADYVDRHMGYVADSGSWSGSQSAQKTLGQTAHRGPKDFHGDCEDHAILRAALLRSLGFSQHCIFCADHHNNEDQGQDQECFGDKKGSGGHTYNLVVYKGKYRILDYGPMVQRYWKDKKCWNQHVTDNIWNDHTGEHWDKKDVSPFGSQPLVNYPGNPSSPGPNWDWRTYLKDITP